MPGLEKWHVRGENSPSDTRLARRERPWTEGSIGGVPHGGLACPCGLCGCSALPSHREEPWKSVTNEHGCVPESITYGHSNENFSKVTPFAFFSYLRL